MRLKIYHPRRNTCFPQDRNGTKGSPHACIITVIQKQYLLSVTLQQTCMSGSKCRSQRCHRIGKPCLMHGYHIHISFTQDQIIFSRGSCNIQPVQIPAFIKNRSLRRVQVLRLSVTHHSASKSDHAVIHIHDRENNPVPELIIHSMPFIHVEQSRFTEPLITVSFGFEVFIQAAAKLVRITKPKFPHRLFTQLTPCEVFMSLPAAFCTELIIIILRRLLIDFQKFCLLLCFFSHFSGIFNLWKFYSRSVRKML